MIRYKLVTLTAGATEKKEFNIATDQKTETYNQFVACSLVGTFSNLT
jgi:hypothetical protein